ncbi:hypothetical protein D9758_011190 [Tetrapyrgos nigripes]|uniref:Thioredoxin domain-containing protein n=1 Tax=Tetrapyrgos nigripes TaxID=182062 RepID=A0A8H5D955_9AGAR|nr:hypothetical protein D9758_011190 [Tetrapyrgos nigripes]
MFDVQLLTLILALTPSLVSAGLFPKDSVVKMLDPKGFRQAIKPNQTTMIAFVAPWCGHCQRMVPEYSKAALGLYPLVPTYAVNCDDEMNKRLCAEQGVQGFPTVKLFPRGKTLPPMTYDQPERSASAFFYWASRRIPDAVKKIYNDKDIHPWVEETSSLDRPRTLLLTKDKKVPLLWKVLANKYKGQLEFASRRDRKGRSSEFMGYEAGEKKVPKVLVYPIGSTKPVMYEGINKLDSLSKFFDSVLDGTADLSMVNQKASEEEFVPSDDELEIERKQEAQRIALAHGGFSDLIDFEEALKNGAGADFHDTHGYGGMMGDLPKKKKVVDKDGKTADAAATPSPDAAAEEDPEPAPSPSVKVEEKAETDKKEDASAPEPPAEPVASAEQPAQASESATERPVDEL